MLHLDRLREAGSNRDRWWSRLPADANEAVVATMFREDIVLAVEPVKRAKAHDLSRRAWSELGFLPAMRRFGVPTR
jgi:hypothetical protein